MCIIDYIMFMKPKIGTYSQQKIYLYNYLRLTNKM